MRRVLRLGTRRSRLATTQSQWVADQLTAAVARASAGSPQIEPIAVELVEITTAGDLSSAPLASIGGTGVFVSALRDALLDGKVDLAVHSLKDLPTEPAAGLALAAVPVREDPRDVLVASGHRTLADLPAGARVGTGSPRRAAQLRAHRPDLEVVGLRGNVDTRLAKVADGQLDAVLLARAGLLRIGRADAVTEVIEPAVILPAPGQGALAVECRDTDSELIELLRRLDHPATRIAVTAERRLLAAVEAGCTAPVGALATTAPEVLGMGRATLRLTAVAAAVDGSRQLRLTREAELPPVEPGADLVGAVSQPGLAARLEQARRCADTLAANMLEAGAADLVRPAPAANTNPPRAILGAPHQAREGDL